MELLRVVDENSEPFYGHEQMVQSQSHGSANQRAREVTFEYDYVLKGDQVDRDNLSIFNQTEGNR